MQMLSGAELGRQLPVKISRNRSNLHYSFPSVIHLQLDRPDCGALRTMHANAFGWAVHPLNALGESTGMLSAINNKRFISHAPHADHLVREFAISLGYAQPSPLGLTRPGRQPAGFARLQPVQA